MRTHSSPCCTAAWGPPPVTPHRYLFHLGTDPGWWGRGVGSALLRPVLEDASSLVQLETKPGNIGY